MIVGFNALMKSNRFAIVDLETTGGKAGRDRVTEIGIVLHDGHQVLDTFHSLVNPECYIPAGIVELTGITQQMVATAPKFYEIAKTVVELTQNTIFVAHNARFDYTFLQEEFGRLGYTFSRKKLCTVQLTRRVFPGLGSYSLGNLIGHFGLPADRRHRALDDALATAALFEKIMANGEADQSVEEMIYQGLKAALLPAGWDAERILELPEACGVYYFHNRAGEVIYVGKSLNIQKRIVEHFRNPRSKGKQMQELTDHISYDITGSELIALLLESQEIKRKRPLINRAQKARSYPYVVHRYRDEEGFDRLEVAKLSQKQAGQLQVLAAYPKIDHARNHVRATADKYGLCLKYTGLETGTGACFHFHLGTCTGTCVGKVAAQEHNERMELAIEVLQQNFQENFFILEDGRRSDEYAVIGVVDGVCIGFGYLEKAEYRGISDLFDCLSKVQQTPEMTQIIRRYLGDQPKVKIVPIPENYL